MMDRGYSVTATRGRIIHPMVSPGRSGGPVSPALTPLAGAGVPKKRRSLTDVENPRTDVSPMRKVALPFNYVRV